MNYTIQVNEVKNTEGNIRAFASLVFGECFKITNIAILETKEKGELFVSMPRYRSSQRNGDNEPVYKDVCNPITKEFREKLYSTILQAYENVKNKTGDKQVKVTDSNEKEDNVTEGKDIADLKFAVSVSLFERENSVVKGLARVFIEDCFVVNNVTIIQGKENLFVALPSYKTKEVDESDRGIYKEVCHPVTKEFRKKLYGKLMEQYEAVQVKNRSKKINEEKLSRELEKSTKNMETYVR